MITEPVLEERQRQSYMGIRAQVSKQELPNRIAQLMAEMVSWLEKKGVAPNGAPFTRYHMVNRENIMEIEVGFTVAKTLSGDRRVNGGIIPSGKYAMLSYTDSREDSKATTKLLNWATCQNIEWDAWESEQGKIFHSRLEIFLGQLHHSPSTWKTQVAIRLADKRPQIRFREDR